MEQFEFDGMTIVVSHYEPIIDATFDHPEEGGEIEFEAYDSDGNLICEEIDSYVVFKAFEEFLSCN